MQSKIIEEEYQGHVPLNPRGRTDLKIITSLLFVPAANFLFFQSPIGSTIGLICLFIVGAIMLFAPIKRGLSQRRFLAIAATLSAASMIEAAHWGQLAVFMSLSIALAISPRLPEKITTQRFIGIILGYALTFWMRLGIDFARIGKIKKRFSSAQGNLGFLKTIILPIIAGGVFIYLFYLANPIISAYLDKIDLTLLYEIFSLERLLFSGAVLAIVWGLLRPYLKIKLKIANVQIEKPDRIYDYLFNQKAVLYSLVLFNTIFAIQNGLDLSVLWSGIGLPAGITYAEYAHRGAFPLILTALLAGAFVLFGLKEADKSQNKTMVYGLVFLWILQNILLVASTIIRTLDYIEVYSLTYMRVAALIWMGLVALGLALIIAKIAFRKTNSWLVSANTLALVTTTLICCFVNFGAIIAWSNVKNCREMGGKGTWLDVQYLQGIGVEALPALLWAKDQNPNNPAFQASLGRIIVKLENELRLNTQDWRAITFRQYRLVNEIVAKPL